MSSIRDFDLSRNIFLRTLEVTERGIVCALCQASSLDAAAGPFAYALSTITSPAFTEVIAFYRDYDFLGVKYSWLNCGTLRRLSPSEISLEARWSNQPFEAFRAMRKVRGFQLVLCADTWDCVREYTVGVLKQAVATERAERGFDDTFPEPLVIHSRRGPYYRAMETYAPFYKPWIPL